MTNAQFGVDACQPPGVDTSPRSLSGADRHAKWGRGGECENVCQAGQFEARLLTIRR